MPPVRPRFLWSVLTKWMVTGLSILILLALLPVVLLAFAINRLTIPVKRSLAARAKAKLLREMERSISHSASLQRRFTNALKETTQDTLTGFDG